MNVLPQDRKLAAKLYECCYLYLERALDELYGLELGADLDEAEKWAKEFLRCKRDLDELVRRKEEHDKLLQVVELMKEKGVDIAIITRGNE
jgi:phosphoserine phosphatase